ncbi:EamA family transporter [Marisediminicola senii]|uniref:EamA family transporter n=1 Tax=Marisediminicola senii TaxID=2711233 RepID=UPI0013EB5C68|nr:EamA family transporter [Marisediminicola senii]
MPPRSPVTAPGRSFGAASLVIVGLLCQDVGASFAVLLFPAVGPFGMVALRLAFSALILLAICRPSLRGYTRGDWLTVTVFGVVLAGMNVMFYEALDRLSLGAAVTIEVLGPLILSVVVSRRAASWLWAVLAFIGVAVLGRGGLGELDPVGVLFAAGAGALWAGYILMSARTGARFPRLDGLAIAMCIGAVVTLPLGIASAGSALLVPSVLLLGVAVAALSSAIPYALELLALRRLPASTFAILMSLSPAIAAAAGTVILGQPLTPIGIVAIVLVVIASAGAVRSAAVHAQREQLAQAAP